MKLFNPKWSFDFKVIIDNHVVVLEQGKQISIPVRVQKIRGNPQKIDLDVNTKWESAGLTAKILFNYTTPSPEWEATLMVKASLGTPPASYLFTVRASAEGTFNTSEDAVTIVVEPKDNRKSGEQESENQDNLPGQTRNMPDASFDLNKLFAPKPEVQTAGIKKAGAGNLRGNSAATWVIALIVGFVIFFVLLEKNGIFDEINSGNNTAGCPPISGCGTVAPQCNCPPDCPKYYIIKTQHMYGYKQCYR